MNPFAEMHWGEGMLLQPQHFQLWQRQVLSTIRSSAEGLRPYAYGLKKLEIAEAALENAIVSIPRCEARLPDGTDLRVPDNADLPDLDIKAALAQAAGKPVEVHLGVSIARPRTPNQEGVGPPGTPRRYRLVSVEVDDENSGENLRPLEVRRLNARLYVAGDEAIQFSSTIPLLRIIRSGAEDAPPGTDPEFVPPVMELEASPRLREMALEVLQRATARSSSLAEMITAQHLDFAVESGGSPEMMLKLHVLNGFLPFYQQLLRIPRIHPLEVFCELCRLAGQLSIFAEERRCPPLPPYDHGSPGPCFAKLFEAVDRLLKALYIVKAPSVKFVPWGRFLVAGLDPVWLEGGKAFYIAVDCDLPAKEVAHIMANQISIGSKETIEQLAKNVIPGIKRRLEEKTPGALPERPRRAYFRLDRKGGEQDLTVGTGELAIFNGSRKEMEFSLYVVSGEKGQFEIQ